MIEEQKTSTQSIDMFLSLFIIIIIFIFVLHYMNSLYGSLGAVTKLLFYFIFLFLIS